MAIGFVGALAQEIANGTLGTTAGLYDPVYAPGYLYVPAGDNTLHMVASPVQQEASDIWLHFNMYLTTMQSAGNTTSSGWNLVRAKDAAGIVMFAIGDNQIPSFGVTNLRLVADAIPSNQVIPKHSTDIYNVVPIKKLVAVDLHWTCDGSVTKIDMYIDGLLIAEASGARTSTSPLATIEFGNMTTTGFAAYSEIIMTTGGESTLGWRLSSMLVAGDGAVAQWHGSFADLATADTTAGIWTDQANKHHIGTFAAYNGASNPLGIRALVQFGRFIENSSGLTVQGSVYNTAGPIMYDTYSQNFVDEARVLTVWDKNPTTGKDWRPSEFTGFQGGFKSLAA